MASKASGASSSWDGGSLKQKCECEFCRTGSGTSHNDASHDQSLAQELKFNGKTFDLRGGTTKCARVTIQYFEDKGKLFSGKSVVEVGSGTGLVGISLAHLGAHVVLTDQKPVLELLEFNVKRNLYTGELDDDSNPVAVKCDIQELLWGDEDKIAACRKSCGGTPDFVIGSDLIYAHEGIAPLVKTCRLLAGQGTVCFVAVIRRFKWEETFFSGMDKHFTTEMVHEEGDIKLYKFCKRKSESIEGKADS